MCNPNLKGSPAHYATEWAGDLTVPQYGMPSSRLPGYNHVRLRVNGTRRKRKGRDSAHWNPSESSGVAGRRYCFVVAFQKIGKPLAPKKNKTKQALESEFGKDGKSM